MQVANDVTSKLRMTIISRNIPAHLFRECRFSNHSAKRDQYSPEIMGTNKYGAFREISMRTCPGNAIAAITEPGAISIASDYNNGWQ